MHAYSLPSLKPPLSRGHENTGKVGSLKAYCDTCARLEKSFSVD
jgi:hypothetical protein